MSFRTEATGEGSEAFSVSELRPAGDAFDGIKKQSSMLSIYQQQVISYCYSPEVLDRGSTLGSLSCSLVSAEAVWPQQQPGHGTAAVPCSGAQAALAGGGLRRGGTASSPWWWWWWMQASAAGVGAPPCAVPSGQPDGQVISVAELPQPAAAFHHEQQRVWRLYGRRVRGEVSIGSSFPSSLSTC